VLVLLAGFSVGDVVSEFSLHSDTTSPTDNPVTKHQHASSQPAQRNKYSQAPEDGSINV